MASSPLQDLQRFDLLLCGAAAPGSRGNCERIRRVADLCGRVLNTTNWIGSVDKAIEDENKLASAPGGEVAVTGKQQEVVRVQSKARPSRRNAGTSGSTK